MPDGEPEPPIRYNFPVEGAKILGSYCLGELIGHDLAIRNAGAQDDVHNWPFTVFCTENNFTALEGVVPSWNHHSKLLH